MRKKMSQYEIEKLKVYGPIFKKKLKIPASSGKVKEIAINFYMREDGALLALNPKYDPTSFYYKSNLFIFKFKNRWEIATLKYDVFGGTYIYRKKTPEGLSIMAKAYKHRDKAFRRIEYLQAEFELLNPLEIKLLRASRNNLRNKLGINQKKAEETKDENAERSKE
jgi:hypothetical protein